MVDKLSTFQGPDLEELQYVTDIWLRELGWASAHTQKHVETHNLLPGKPLFAALAAYARQNSSSVVPAPPKRNDSHVSTPGRTQQWREGGVENCRVSTWSHLQADIIT